MDQDKTQEKIDEQIEKLKATITPESVARKVVRGIAKHSVGFVAATLTKTYVPTENKKQQLQLTIGAYVAGGMAGDAAAAWAEKEIDEFISNIKSVIETIKKIGSDKEQTPEEAPEPSEEPTE